MERLTHRRYQWNGKIENFIFLLLHLVYYFSISLYNCLSAPLIPSSRFSSTLQKNQVEPAYGERISQLATREKKDLRIIGDDSSFALPEGLSDFILV